MLDNVKELATGKAPAVRAGDQGSPQTGTIPADHRDSVHVIHGMEPSRPGRLLREQEIRGSNPRIPTRREEAQVSRARRCATAAPLRDD
jgi:hypothetical protein